ncbi:hypothetical protein LCGC14_2640360, partial [marine sediment metagenome]
MVGKKNLKNISETNKWKIAEFDYAGLYVQNQMPLLGERLSAKQMDKYMGEILANCPDFFPALFYRGRYLLSIGKDSQALKFYDRGFKLLIEILEGEELIDAVDSVIDGLEELLRFDLCCRYLKNLIKLFPNKGLYYDYLAGNVMKSKEGSISEVIALQKKAIELEPENATFIHNLGWIHLEAGNLKEAEIEMKKALKLRPDYESAAGNMAVINYLKKKKNGGTFLDYLIRLLDRKKLQQLEDEEEYDELDALCADYNASRIEAFKRIMLDEHDYPPDQITNLAKTLHLFLSFVDGVLNEGMFLYDDLHKIDISFKPIMHKFIFKHKDIDDEIFNDIYTSLTAFYGFLSQYKLLDRG